MFVLTAALFPTGAGAADGRATAAADGPFWAGHPDTATYRAMQERRLDNAQKALDRVLAVKGRRTLENTLRVYDDALRELEQVSSQSSLIENVHPDSSMRDAAEKMSQRAAAFATALSLNREVYDALAALELDKADAATKHYVTRTLRDFRLAGVDKDEATRERIRKLNQELVLTGQEFQRNIRSDVRTVQVADAKELEGLPEDYIERHKPGADGRITLTTEYPDAFPVLSYAKRGDLRKRMYMEFNNRAHPKNMAVLDSLLSKRAQLAALLGFDSWADYITADKMVGSAARASEFIDRIVEASGPRAQKDYGQLLQRKRKDAPDAGAVDAWDASYYSELVRREEYDFNAQSMRPYLPFQRVKQGVLDVTSRLFGVEFRQVKDAPVWHPAVECWEMFEDGRLTGRFYLDMHPRRNKYSHAAQFDVRTGLAGRQIPEGALVCNFPGGEPDDPGLMEHSDVRTFFHEFGHLLHTLFAGGQQYVGIGGIRTEHDFVEAPSQMLEEWTQDTATLQTFAKHHETGAAIPAELVRQMVRANEFGKGLAVRRQMVFARTSLSFYDRRPSEVDTDRLIREIVEKYQPFPYVEGTHLQTAFGHLDGYSAVYYTYMWSSVIAKDLFSAFNRQDLLDPAKATQYRRSILAAGGSAPAASLIEAFLGRPFSFDAWTAWLNQSL